MTQIRTEPRPCCALCGNRGSSLYAGLKDRLFGVSGLWDMKQCTASDCDLIWLDPAPVEDELYKAYTNYYTHLLVLNRKTTSSFRRFCAKTEHAYVRWRFGYPSAPSGFLSRSIGSLFFRWHSEGGSTFARYRPQGRLLDLGCGAGAYLLGMQSLGWEVEGIDFDLEAVAAARVHGLNVRSGCLEDQRYPSGSFNVIMMNHVVEHLTHPIETLREVLRVLKPGGVLLLFTPNTESLGHRLFGAHWRGLEPPRHLHLFSAASLRKALLMAGFENISIRPQIGSSLIYHSCLLCLGRNGVPTTALTRLSAHVLARSAAAVQLCLLPVSRSVSDCLAAVAAKS
jgi:2-polyprenyl-3-methyl-5-hydroxy-6-metoxy-1,4-benzoquinol methylase